MNSSGTKKTPEPRLNGLTIRQAAFMSVLWQFGRVGGEHLEQLCLQSVPGKSRKRVMRRVKASLRKLKFLVEDAPPGIQGDPKRLVRITSAGLEWCDATFNDPVIMAQQLNYPQPFHQNHTLRLVDTHIMVWEAAKQLDGLKLHRWIKEHEVVNYWEHEAKLRHTLRLQLKEKPPLVVDPDAFFHVSFHGIDGMFAVEEDCCTIAAERVARVKSKGFAELSSSSEKRHRKFFPECSAKGFRVLLITTKETRRDRLCEALAAYDVQPDLWRVASKTELTAETFFTAPVWRTHEKQAATLLPKDPAKVPVESSPNPQLAAMASISSTTGTA